MIPKKAETADELADVALRKQTARRASSWSKSDPSAAGGYNPDLNKRITAALEGAYNHFNNELFSDKLPSCMISLQSIPTRNGKATFGYFSNARFATRDGSSVRDAIALNPLTFRDRDALDILSTLAHEMAHCWQHHSGNPSRGYHDQKWAAHMIEIGLMPSATGQVGGKQTGWQMTHYVIKGGRFEIAAKALIAAGFKVEWYDRGLTKTQRGGGGRRDKYKCPACKFSVWGATGGVLYCEHGHASERMENETQAKILAASIAAAADLETTNSGSPQRSAEAEQVSAGQDIRHTSPKHGHDLSPRRRHALGCRLASTT